MIDGKVKHEDRTHLDMPRRDARDEDGQVSDVGRPDRGGRSRGGETASGDECGAAARETAALFDDEAQIDHSFDDLDYGRWHGRSIRDVHDEDAAGLEAWLSDPTSAPHGGESLEALAGDTS